MHYLPQGFAVEVSIGIGEHDKGRFFEMYTAVQGGCLALAVGLVVRLVVCCWVRFVVFWVVSVVRLVVRFVELLV